MYMRYDRISRRTCAHVRSRCSVWMIVTMTTAAKRRSKMASSKMARNKARRTDHAPGGRFRVIYTDPPWPWNHSKQLGFLASTSGTTYDIASLTDLWSMDVRSCAADDAVMFMWVLNGFLEPAIL